MFFALKWHVAVRFFALLLLFIAGISFVRSKNMWIFICILLFSFGLVIFNNDIFLKLYPVLMNFNVCFMFASSLHRTPLIEKVAIKMGYMLDAKQKRYAKRVTSIWAIFMLCLAVFSLITVFLSDEIWVIFNGLISYILIGMMICVEFIVRKKVMDVHRNK